MSDRSERARQPVGVVLVNWNGAQHTIPCIESLLSGSERPDRIVVVDNASRDGSADQIAARFPDVEVVRNPRNLGFTGGNNVGIGRLLEAGCAYVWILNNDTIVDTRCLAGLKEYLRLHPDVSACSGKILYAEPRTLIWYAGATHNRWTLRSPHRGEREHDVGQYERAEPVPFLSGCCMFVRREALESLGAFDDRYFAYEEDNDWCLRAGEARRRLDYVPQAVLWHKVSATVRGARDRNDAGTSSPFGIYIGNRNRLFVIRKHAAGSPRMITALLAHALWVGYYAAGLLVLGRIGKLEALVWSVVDGLRLPLEGAASIGERPRYLG